MATSCFRPSPARPGPLLRREPAHGVSLVDMSNLDGRQEIRRGSQRDVKENIGYRSMDRSSGLNNRRAGRTTALHEEQLWLPPFCLRKSA